MRAIFRLFILVFFVSLTACGGGSSDGPMSSEGIWIARAELMQLPMAGPAWDALLEDAKQDPGTPNLSDQGQDNNVLILAKAFVCVRTGNDLMCDEVRQAVMDAMETENGGSTLALSRELLAYVIAADLVHLDAADNDVFRVWLEGVVIEDLNGRTLVSTHENRPNNWGTHAGASRAAVAVYLGDQVDLDRTAQVFKGYLGDRATYDGFTYGALDWQADPSRPVGINPVGATKVGHNIDGAQPEEMRRNGSGEFIWPPPKEDYAYEALQGSLALAVILHRAGYGDVWEWEDRALLRAFDWLHEQANFPTEGDDTWQPHVVNHFYGTNFPTSVPSRPGKNVGFTDWTFGPGSSTLAARSPDPPIQL